MATVSGCAMTSRRYSYLLDLAVQHRVPVLLAGASGTGKTCTIAAHLMSGIGLPHEHWLPLAVTLSARTTAAMLQDQVRGMDCTRHTHWRWFILQDG